MSCAENEAFLSLGKYFEYLESIPSSRNVLEGEAILNGGHLFMCGKLERNKMCLDVFGLYLQTSGLTSDPQEIRGKIVVEEGSASISAFCCSCKAGLGDRCKLRLSILY